MDAPVLLTGASGYIGGRAVLCLAALRALLPSSRLVRVKRQSGGVEDGACVVFSVGVGPLRMRWVARHYGYLRSLYEDRVEYAVPGGRLAQRLAAPVLRSLLTRAFARRHRIVRAAVASSFSRDDRA